MSKKTVKKVWNFIWNDDSLLSWIVNIVLAFLLIYFIVYPVLGTIFQTTHPIVAVVSGSMEHDGSLDDWWNSQEAWYEENTDLTKQDFIDFRFTNGFNKGDLMVLRGTSPDNIKEGDVIVYHGRLADPIIHRVVKTELKDNINYFVTKGDHNSDSDFPAVDERYTVGYEKYQKTSKAVLRIPYLGYIKIWFVQSPIIFTLIMALIIVSMSYSEEIINFIRGKSK